MTQIRFEGLRPSALSALSRSPVALGVVVRERSTQLRFFPRDLTEEAIAAFIARGGERQGEFRPSGSLLGYGRAIGRIGVGESAFNQRDAKFEFLTSAGWEDPGEDEARIAGPRRYGTAMEPFSSGVYVNVLADEGAAAVRDVYRVETLTRLSALKGRYDPENVFHLNHTIAPSSGGSLTADPA